MGVEYDRVYKTIAYDFIHLLGLNKKLSLQGTQWSIWEEEGWSYLMSSDGSKLPDVTVMGNKGK